MPGIGFRTAIKVLTIVGDGSAFPTAAHLASYAGLAPVTRSSSTSIKGESHSQRRHHALKSALFLSAFAALKDPDSRAYYDRKRAGGRRHNAALICLARRRVDALFAMLRDKTGYRPVRPLSRPDYPSRLDAGHRDAPTLAVGTEAPDRNLAMELVRVTEAAAMAGGRWVGRGDKNKADGAAVNAMRTLIGTVSMNGTVVIGEGEKDNAPMLFNGERVGDGTGAECDVAVDPIDGTTLTAREMPNAVAVLAVAEATAERDTGLAEDRIRCLKDTGTSNLPAHGFDANQPLAADFCSDQRPTCLDPAPGLGRNPGLLLDTGVPAVTVSGRRRSPHQYR